MLHFSLILMNRLNLTESFVLKLLCSSEVHVERESSVSKKVTSIH